MRHPTVAIPTVAFATQIAADVTGYSPTGASRFMTGMRHYVYEVQLAGRPPVIVRIGDQSAHDEMEGAVRLSDLLKPRGVPLPTIIAASVRSELPWLVLERLAGSDLGAVINKLSHEQLDHIADRVAHAQAITSNTALADRYGYAALPGQAPYSTWSQVLDANLDRSQVRIEAAGLFDPAQVEIVRSAIAAHQGEIDQIAPIPFLHDTTTKNVIVTEDGSFSGIVDVDDLCFGDPRYPAALTLAVLLAYGGPVEYVSAWLRHARQQDDQIFRLYVSLFLLDLMAEHGQMFNGNRLPSGLETRSSLSRVFQDSLKLATAKPT